MIKMFTLNEKCSCVSVLNIIVPGKNTRFIRNQREQYIENQRCMFQSKIITQ